MRPRVLLVAGAACNRSASPLNCDASALRYSSSHLHRGDADCPEEKQGRSNGEARRSKGEATEVLTQGLCITWWPPPVRPPRASRACQVWVGAQILYSLQRKCNVLLLCCSAGAQVEDGTQLAVARVELVALRLLLLLVRVEVVVFCPHESVSNDEGDPIVR